MKDTDKSKVGFLLRNIKTEQFATIDKAYKEDVEISIKIGFDFGILEKEKGIACNVHVEFETDNCPFIIIEIRCDFGVEPSAWDSMVNEEKNEITFPGGFLQHLAVLTTGTARGILHAKTEGTKFSNLIMPTMNITKLVNKPIPFDLEAKSEHPA